MTVCGGAAQRPIQASNRTVRMAAFPLDHEMGRHAEVGGTFIGPANLQQQTVLVAIADESNPDGQAAHEAGWDGEARRS